MKAINKSIFSVAPIILLYLVLNLLSLNYCYFWDNIQQISKEAHWYFITDFKSLLMPTQNSGSEIVATGYHPPLMGIMTAMLWKVFGYHLWVSHIFSLFWFFILSWNLQKITSRFFNEKSALWVFTIILAESTLLTQFVIASPDFILFTAFVVSLRAILERKNSLLAIGIFFLCAINMRGVFVGLTLFISHLYYINIQTETKSTTQFYIKTLTPYIPTLIILLAYYLYYLLSRGWFFSNPSYSEHYSLPNSLFRIVKHIAEFGLRSIENGRIIIWIVGISTAYLSFRKRTKLLPETRFLLMLFSLLTGIYILFIFITQMPFSARYFMPQFFVLTILAMYGLCTHLKQQHLKYAFILIILFELSGNLWIYPDKIAKSWDCTLAHLPYYELRKDCFEYLDTNKINYKDVSAGFCLYGNRQFIELNNSGKIISSGADHKYFIYSNISNIEDKFANELINKNLWTNIKAFKKGYVEIIIYKRVYQQFKQ